MDKKKLFFAAQIAAAWPSEFPPGRILKENNRHLTLAFLGLTLLPPLIENLETIPPPPFSLGLAGEMNRWVFLPSEKKPHVVAGEASWFSKQEELIAFQRQLTEWLAPHGYLKKKQRPFFPHITVARKPFNTSDWRNFPCQIPFYLCSIALQESLGHSHYNTVWESPLLPPFEEIEHTADIAFLVRGSNFQDLLLHAELALAFKFPSLLSFRLAEKVFSLDDVIAALNRLIGRVDQSQGIGLKAVSYHDEMTKGRFLEWKMIVDV